MFQTELKQNLQRADLDLVGRTWWCEARVVSEVWESGKRSVGAPSSCSD